MRQLVALSGAGIDEVVVVLGHHAERHRGCRAAVSDDAGAQPIADDGQASSVRIGLQQLSPRLDAVMVALADQPLIGEEDIVALIGAFKKRRRRADGRAAGAVGGGETAPGNPVIFDAALREEWLAGERRSRVSQWRRRTRLACAGSTPTTGATGSTSTRPRTWKTLPRPPVIG